MLVRMPDTALTFANLARSLVFGAIVTLKLGMDILAGEQVRMDALLGHGGFFKTPGTAQKLLAGALGVPVVGDGHRGRGRALGHGAAGRLPRAPRGRRDAGSLPQKQGLCRRQRHHAGPPTPPTARASRPIPAASPGRWRPSAPAVAHLK